MQLMIITLELQNRCTVALYCNLSTAFPLKINIIARHRILDRSQLTFVKMRNIRATGNGCADTSEVTRAEPLEWVINNNVKNLKKVKTENGHHTPKNLGFLNSFFIPLHHFLKNMWILNISTAQGHRFSLFWSKTEGLPFKGSFNSGILRYKIWKLE